MYDALSDISRYEYNREIKMIEDQLEFTVRVAQDWKARAEAAERRVDVANNLAMETNARLNRAERRVAELEAEVKEVDEWRQRWASLWLWSFAPPDVSLEKGWYDVYYWERQEFGEAFYDNGVFTADGDQVFPTHYAPQRNAPGVPPPTPPPAATE